MHMFPDEAGQKHLARNTKGQQGSQAKDSYRAESEKLSCIK
jgi:hypothetical protein